MYVFTTCVNNCIRNISNEKGSFYCFYLEPKLPYMFIIVNVHYIIGDDLNFHSSTNQELVKYFCYFHTGSSISKLLILSTFILLSNNIVAKVPYHPAHKNTVPRSNFNFLIFLATTFCFLFGPDKTVFIPGNIVYNKRFQDFAQILC